MHIAMIGAGNIGGTLARKWTTRGHQLTFGVRDRNKPALQQLLEELGPGARATGIVDAVPGADVVVFAIPGRSMAEAVVTIGDALDGKIVIDATNNIGGGVFNSMAAITSAAPRAQVYRAFNTYGWENLAAPMFDDVAADLFYAGPDGDGRAVTERLIADVGLRPVRVGGPDKVGLVDSILPLWFTLSSEAGLGRHFAFKILGIRRDGLK